MKKTLFLSLTMTCMYSSSLLAQTDNGSDAEELEGINVVGKALSFGATKSEIPVDETPRSLSIISQEEFTERGALVIDNTLEYSAGVIGSQFGFATRSDQATVRGLPAPQYQDNLQNVFGSFNNTNTDIYTLERVEVLKGPASVLYGQAQPGGILSLVSKVASPLYQDKEVVLSVGNNSRFRVGTDLGFDLSRDGTWTGRLLGVFQDSDTQVDFVEDDSVVFAPSITYQNDTTTLTALLNYTRDEGAAAAQFLPISVTGCPSGDAVVTGSNVCSVSSQQVDNSLFVGDPNFNRFDAESTTLSLLATHVFNDVFSFNGTARYRDNESDYQQSWVSFNGDGVQRVFPDGTAISRTFFDSERGSDQLAFDARLLADFDTGNVSHQFAAGLNYQRVNQFQRDATIRLDAAGLTTDFNVFRPINDGRDTPPQAILDSLRGDFESETEAVDVYFTNQSTIGNLILNAGIRFSSVDSEDALNDQSDSESPISIGALYKTDIGLNPYINYSESFLATVGTDVVTGSSLLPQEGEQFEVGFKYQPEGSKSFITLAYFDIEQNNLIDFVPGGRTQDGRAAEISGVELEAYAELGEFSVDLNLTHLDPEEISSTGQSVPLQSVPDTTASLWVKWTPSAGIFDNFSFGSGVRYASSNESNGVGAFGPVRVVTDGYTVFDSAIIYKGFKNLDLSLNIRNLTNEEFQLTCLARGDCFPAEERTIVAQAAYKF